MQTFTTHTHTHNTQIHTHKMESGNETGRGVAKIPHTDSANQKGIERERERKRERERRGSILPSPHLWLGWQIQTCLWSVATSWPEHRTRQVNPPEISGSNVLQAPPVGSRLTGPPTAGVREGERHYEWSYMSATLDSWHEDAPQQGNTAAVAMDEN